MSDLVNEFSWSVSREKTLVNCQRAYYWKHYGSWHGWELDAPEEARLAYRLKQMANLQTWPGQVVHTVIEQALGAARLGRLIPQAPELHERARGLLLRGWFESKDGAWRERPKKFLNLREHYYEQEITLKAREELKGKVFTCLTNWRESQALHEILEAKDWPVIEALIKFPVRGIDVYLRPDFAARRDGVFILYDWKTGKQREEDKFQMLGYAMLACRVFGERPPNIEVVLAYLKDGETVRHRPRLDELAQAADAIEASVERMKRFLRDPNVNEAAKGDFQLAANARTCGRCEFLELCKPELTGILV